MVKKKTDTKSVSTNNDMTKQDTCNYIFKNELEEHKIDGLFCERCQAQVNKLVSRHGIFNCSDYILCPTIESVSEEKKNDNQRNR